MRGTCHHEAHPPLFSQLNVDTLSKCSRGEKTDDITAAGDDIDDNLGHGALIQRCQIVPLHNCHDQWTG